MVWNFEQYRDHTAVLDENGNQLTYQELMETGCRLAGKIGGRCLVFILCKNRVGALIGYTACLNHNIVPLLLEADLDKEFLDKLLMTYKPDYLLAPQNLEKELDKFLLKYRFWGYSLLETGYKKTYQLNTELSLLLATSGSTGSPKLVRLGYHNILANMQTGVFCLGIDSSKKLITVLPVSHIYELAMVSTYLSVGAKILLTEKGVLQKEFWDFFKQNEATSFDGVPFTYEMLEKIQFRRMDLPSLEIMTQGGGKLELSLQERFSQYAQQRGKAFYIMFGATETTSWMTCLSEKDSFKKGGSVGRATPVGKVYIIDNHGNKTMNPDVTGELICEGLNVALGYAGCGEDLIKGDENHGWITTGDIARFDQEGFCYIVGRKKRFLKVLGNRVSLDELDSLIKAHFSELDCACTGTDDRVHIFITQKGMEEQVRKFISEKTCLHFSVFSVHAIDRIPRNGSGKVNYKELEQYDRS